MLLAMPLVPHAGALSTTVHPTPSRVGSTMRRLWNGPRQSSEVHDYRMRCLADTIAEEPDNWPRIRRKIAEVGLSPAYLSVRFKESVGLPMRSYALWMKFEQATEKVLEGARPSDAALDAGFADQSHLGRAARRFAKKSFWRAISDVRAELDGDVPGQLSARRV